MQRSRPVTPSAPWGPTVSTFLLAAVVATAAIAISNDPIGDVLAAGGPDIESLLTQRTDDSLLITLNLVGAFPPPTPNGNGVVGFIDLDTDRNPGSGQQSAIDFLGASRTPVLRSHLGVEYQLVLSSFSTEDDAIDLVDQTNHQPIARVQASFFGSALTVTIPESVLDGPTLDGLHLAAVVGNGDTFSDTAPNQGFVTTAAEEGETLHDGRFTVAVDWTNFQGETGTGTLVTKSTDSALFWFFQEANWELLVKVINGCSLTNTYWVFSAATTDVGFTLTVTDTSSGTVRIYDNPLGTAAPAITDTGAFATCE